MAEEKNTEEEVEKNSDDDGKNDSSTEKNNEKFDVNDIRETAKRFWKNFGNEHPVSEWPDNADGKKLIKYFNSNERNDELFRDCTEYGNCVDKYQQEKTADQENEYNEAMVAYERLLSNYDVAFYIVLSNFPKCLISTKNLHTMNFVMSEFKKTGETGSIVKIAQEKIQKKMEAQAKTENEQSQGSPENEDEQNKDKPQEEKKDPEEEKKTPEEEKKKSRFGYIIQIAAEKLRGDNKQWSEVTTENERVYQSPTNDSLKQELNDAGVEMGDE